jgi:hypothetical protein
MGTGHARTNWQITPRIRASSSTTSHASGLQLSRRADFSKTTRDQRWQVRGVIQNRTKEPASETIRFDAGGWTAIRTLDLLRPQVKGPQLVFQPPQACDSRFHLLLLLLLLLLRCFLWRRRFDSLQYSSHKALLLYFLIITSKLYY